MDQVPAEVEAEPLDTMDLLVAIAVHRRHKEEEMMIGIGTAMEEETIATAEITGTDADAN